MQKNYNNIYINERKILNEWVHVNKKIEILKKNLSSFAPKFFFLHCIFEYLLEVHKKNFKSLALKIKDLSRNFKKNDFTQVRPPLYTLAR